ncbi:MAG: hypothetical protein U9532_00220 ['Conium maculatum' witches'-broom phytoplasma]|nr:hypothetical protein ['Conium maculatum' witches'-broom phytoplasma]
MNFLKKHWVAILIILIFSAMIIIGYFETKKEEKTLSNNHEELEDNKESNQPSRKKRDIEELPKSKIKITQKKYDKIKPYILSENENEVLSLSDLNQKETTVIEKARNKQKRILNYRKKNKEGIQKIQQECDDYNKKISELDPKQDGYKNKLEYLKSALSDAIKLRDSLQRDYDNDISRNTYGDPLKNINSLYEIASNEG